LGAQVITLKESPGESPPGPRNRKGAAMKMNITIDMTPEEARAFMGLPEVAPMQQKMMDEMQGRMKAAFDANDPEGMMRAWMPLGGAEAFQKFQKLMWDSASMVARKDGK
jgi:hypothetical protein